MGSSFYLESVTYALDGAPIYTKTDLDGDLDKRDEFEVFNGRIVPGNHQLAVQMVFRGHGFGLFSYLQEYRFKTQSAYTINAEPGKAITVKVIGFEKGGLTSELKDRPNIKYEQEIQKEDPGARQAGSPRGRHEVRQGRQGSPRPRWRWPRWCWCPVRPPAPRWTSPKRRPRRWRRGWRRWRRSTPGPTRPRPPGPAGSSPTERPSSCWRLAARLDPGLRRPRRARVPGRARRAAGAALPRRFAPQPGYCGAALATYDELRRLTAPDLQLAALIGPSTAASS